MTNKRRFEFNCMDELNKRREFWTEAFSTPEFPDEVLILKWYAGQWRAHWHVINKIEPEIAE